MCGIAGFNRAAKRSSIPDGRRFARMAAIAVESRGRHATGFGWFEDDGQAWYWKEQGPATRVAHRAPLPTKLRTIIAHTRHATTGSPSVYENNHPVIAEGLVLVHNGRCDNHRELFDMLNIARVGEVDSEAIAALLAYGPAMLDASGPTDLLELVEGVASLAWLDCDDPDVLHLARLSTRPLTIGWTRRGDLVFSSTPATLQLTAKMTGVRISKVEEVPQGTYLRVEAGRIVERRTFAVQHPVAAVPDDRPGVALGRKKAAEKLPDDYTLDDFDTWVRRRERREAIEQQMLWDGDRIDWDNLVPRRGWK